MEARGTKGEGVQGAQTVETPVVPVRIANSQIARDVSVLVEKRFQSTLTGPGVEHHRIRRKSRRELLRVLIHPVSMRVQKSMVEKGQKCPADPARRFAQPAKDGKHRTHGNTRPGRDNGGLLQQGAIEGEGKNLPSF